MRAGFTFLNAQGNTEYEGSGSILDKDADFVFQVAGVKLEIPVTKNLRTSLQLSDARDESENFNSADGTTISVFNTRTRNSRLENWLTVGTHEFVFGAEYSVDSVESTVVYDESSRSNSAFFGQALLNFDALDFHLSLRSDDNEAFGTGKPGVPVLVTQLIEAIGYALVLAHRLKRLHSTLCITQTLAIPHFSLKKQ